jgi:hypothetical protein
MSEIQNDTGNAKGNGRKRKPLAPHDALAILASALAEVELSGLAVRWANDAAQGLVVKVAGAEYDDTARAFVVATGVK